MEKCKERGWRQQMRRGYLEGLRLRWKWKGGGVKGKERLKKDKRE